MCKKEPRCNGELPALKLWSESHKEAIVPKSEPQRKACEAASQQLLLLLHQPVQARQIVIVPFLQLLFCVSLGPPPVLHAPDPGDPIHLANVVAAPAAPEGTTSLVQTRVGFPYLGLGIDCLGALGVELQPAARGRR